MNFYSTKLQLNWPGNKQEQSIKYPTKFLWEKHLYCETSRLSLSAVFDKTQLNENVESRVVQTEQYWQYEPFCRLNQRMMAETRTAFCKFVFNRVWFLFSEGTTSWTGIWRLHRKCNIEKVRFVVSLLFSLIDLRRTVTILYPKTKIAHFKNSHVRLVQRVWHM